MMSIEPCAVIPTLHRAVQWRDAVSSAPARADAGARIKRPARPGPR